MPNQGFQPSLKLDDAAFAMARIDVRMRIDEFGLHGLRVLVQNYEQRYNALVIELNQLQDEKEKSSVGKTT